MATIDIALITTNIISFLQFNNFNERKKRHFLIY